MTLRIWLSYRAQRDAGSPIHVVVFKYGSVVFFNIPRRSEIQWEYIGVCKKYTAEPLALPNEDGLAESRSMSQGDIVVCLSVHSLLIRPNMVHWHRQEDNHVVLKVLDVDNIKVISSVLGQSVALDRFSKSRPSEPI